MNLARTRAIAKKEFIHIVRDPRSLGMAIAIPMLLIFLFGYALTLDVDHVPVAVWDRDGTKVSREFMLNFGNSPYFDVRGYVSGYKGLQRAIDNGTCLMGIVIPEDFSKRIEAGREAPVQVLADGSNSNTATIAIGYVNAIAAKYNKEELAVDMRTRIWFNPDLKSRNYIIPGLIAVIMMVIAALLTSLTVSREWERGTMEQLISTPVSPMELIAGKFIPYFFIGMIDVIMAVSMGEFLFRVPMHGALGLLFVLSGIFMTVVLCMGILISITNKSQFIASQLALVTTFLPAFLLSGFAFPISNMPAPVQFFTYIIPARYFVKILKDIYLKGAGPSVFWGEMLSLMVFALVIVRLAGSKFKKKVS
jgi:ABC-2 type transport system permease protein